MSRPFDPTKFEALRDQRGLGFGQPFRALASTGSTNDEVLEAAKLGLPAGLVIVADAQTRGRGRQGSAWHSPPGDNLTFSLLLRPQARADRVSALPLAVGLGLRDAVAARVDARVRIKWPNDVLVDGHKLAGVLVESVMRGPEITALAVGIGLNVATRGFPSELRATSLAMLDCPELDREMWLVELLARLEERVDQYLRAGLPPLLDELNAHDALFGQRVRVGAVSGVAQGIGQRGGLMVCTPDGATVEVRSGHVEQGSALG